MNLVRRIALNMMCAGIKKYDVCKNLFVKSGTPINITNTQIPPQPTSITNFMLKVLFIGDNIFTRNLSRNIKLNIEDHV